MGVLYAKVAGDWEAAASGGGGGITTEDAVDAVAAALVAGNNVDITYNDAANTITVDVEALAIADVSGLQTALDAKADDGDLTTHAADTTAVHGIADTSVLETTTGSQAKVNTHTGQATGAHAATAISYAGSTNLAVVTVEAALDELDAEKQPLDTDLTTIAGLTATTDNVIQSVGSAWASRTPTQLKTTLALTKTDVGLGNVDNTSDVNKPVSTAQQAAFVKLVAQDCAVALTTTVTHNFNTRDVKVEVYRTTTPWDTVDVDVERDTVNSVLVRFAVTPAAAAYRIIVEGIDQ